jgi:putative addiction module CopG family antidote
MEVHFTPEQRVFVRLAVKSGRYRSAEDAVRDAILRWEEDERLRAESSLPQLALELKSEGRAFAALKGRRPPDGGLSAQPKGAPFGRYPILDGWKC